MSSKINTDSTLYRESEVVGNWTEQYLKTNLDKHKELPSLDHPDGSVGYEKLSEDVKEIIASLDRDTQEIMSGISYTNARILGVENSVDAVGEIAHRAQTSADAAQSAIDEAEAITNMAYNLAINGKAEAGRAQAAADIAQATADTAQATANTAQTAADTAQATADTAQTAADTAQATADANTQALADKVDKKVFEEIATVIVTAGENGVLPNSVVITVDNNGEPFGLSEFVIEAMIGTSETATMSLFVHENGVDRSVFFGNKTISGAKGNLAKWMGRYITVGDYGGVFLMNNSVFVVNKLPSANENNIAGQVIPDTIGTIKGLKVKFNQTLMEGSTFTIKGVRV